MLSFKQLMPIKNLILLFIVLYLLNSTINYFSQLWLIINYDPLLDLIELIKHTQISTNNISYYDINYKRSVESLLFLKTHKTGGTLLYTTHILCTICIMCTYLRHINLAFIILFY